MTYLSDRILSRLRQMPEEQAELSPEMLGEESPAERFVLDTRVGAGGMGEVYRGRDRQTGRAVAIKLLDAVSTNDYERFRREASSLALLAHPAIVRYVAHGRLGGRAFLVMEWLEGENLESRLNSSGLTIAQSVALGRLIAQALEAAHERGIVHRDVKPSNVFLPEGEPGRAKLIDFGIAHRIWSERTLTGTGMIIGTPGYMSPEQARASGWIDARADIFALGCVLYHCLTGRRAFRGEDPIALLTKTVFSDPPRPQQLVPRVPQPLDELVMRMLDKEPRRRPADMREVIEALGNLPPLDDRSPAPTSLAYPLLTRLERRLSSVLLIGRPPPADGLPSSRNPEWPAWSSAARAHGVRLEPLADGSIAAVLGAHSSARDSVLHMARAALALRPLIPEAAMVLVTGRGVVEHDSRTGEVVDRAARALAASRSKPQPLAARAIQIDRITASLLSPHFEVAKAEKRWWLSGQRLRDEQEAPFTPFVGRQRELSELEAIFIECVRHRRAAAAIVTGSAGVGKSRLLHELVGRLRSRERIPTFWIGRADVSRLGSPFTLLGRALRYGLELTDAHEPSARIAKLVAALGQPASDLGSADAVSLAERLLPGWLELVSQETRITPLVLVLEDLQWADAPSVDFVARALRRFFDRPLFVIASTRSDDAPLTDPFAGVEAKQFVLSGLSRKHSTELVRNLLGADLPPARVRRVVARADGNPFVLEELGRSVVAGHDELPETALALIETRLEALAPETRRVLRAASIFGESFWAEGVETLVDDVVVSNAIEDLLAHSLVTRVAPSRLPPYGELAFRHSLIREAAYATLTAEDRGLGHRLAADWLVHANEPDPWPVAEHRRLGGQPERAIEPYARAARAALEASDFPEVLVRVGRAFECVEQRLGSGVEKPLLGSLHLMEAEARRWIGEPRSTLEAAHQALAYFPRASEGWFRSVAELCAAAGRLGDYERLGRVLEAAARTRVSGELASVQIASLCPAVGQLLQAGRSKDAERMHAAIEEIARSAPMDSFAQARLEQLRGFQWLFHGRPWQAARCFARARAAFEALGSSKNAAIEAINFANAAIEVGDFEDAEAALRESLRIGELFGLSAVRAYASLNLGRLLIERGELDEAERMEAVALEIGMGEKSPRTTGAARVQLAWIALARGDHLLAEAEALTAADLLEVAPPLRAGALAVVARARLARGAAEEARPPAEAALALVESGQQEMFEAHVRVVHIEMLRAAGELEAAKGAIRRATDALLARADEIPDPNARARLLERVSIHARMLELRRELGA